jgi:hypothetical protein
VSSFSSCSSAADSPVTPWFLLLVTSVMVSPVVRIYTVKFTVPLFLGS